MQGSNHPSAQATRISLLYLRSMVPSGNRTVSHPLTLSLSSRLIFLIRVHKAASDMYWYRNSSCSNPVHPPGICRSCSFFFKSFVFSTSDSHGAVPTAAFDEERRALLLLHALPSCPSRFLFVRHLLPSHSARAGCNPKRRIVRAFRSTFAVLRASHSLPIDRASNAPRTSASSCKVAIQMVRGKVGKIPKKQTRREDGKASSNPCSSRSRRGPIR